VHTINNKIILKLRQMSSVVYVPKSSKVAVAKGIVNDLSKCFPNKTKAFLENDLQNKNYDMFYVVKDGVSDGFFAAKVDDNNDVYITHVCKTSQQQGIFGKLLDKAKDVYPNANKFYLKVREDNEKAVATYKKAGFRVRTDVLMKPTANNKGYTLTMNTTQLDDAVRIARNMRVGDTYEGTGVSKNVLSNALLEVTRDRWLYHKQKWVYAKTDDAYMHLIYGNLAVTMFLAINQYIDGSVKPFVAEFSDVPLQTYISVTDIKKIGANYWINSLGNSTHKYGTKAMSLDVFKNTVYDKSFPELKKIAKSVFDTMYLDMISREPPPKDVSDSRTVLAYVNRNFTGRGNTDIMRFYTHNLGVYQFLAMYGYTNGYIYPFSGNCAVISIFRLALYEKITNSANRNVQLVASSKRINNSQEICHYGLRTKNMTKQERVNGGNFQYHTRENWGYLTPISSINDYNKMYDVLSANGVYRAKLRANRNKLSRDTRYALNAFSNTIKAYMFRESKLLHNHKVMQIISANKVLNGRL
jgi:GNAT superfamily N-acetyltransferase